MSEYQEEGFHKNQYKKMPKQNTVLESICQPHSAHYKIKVC